MKPKVRIFRFSITLLFMIVCLSTKGQPINVIIKHGNVWLIDTSGAEKQLTSTGKDTIPYMSDNKKYIAFVRKTNGPKNPGSNFDSSQIWLIDLDSNTSNLVVQSKPDSGTTLSLLRGGFDALQFSPDSKYLYFLSRAWTVSMAVHCIDLTTKQDQFITDGNSLFVIPSGVYEGDLIVSKLTPGGSYDGKWLLTPDGTEIKDLGRDKLEMKIKQ